jgi:hypothetical protein
LTLQRDKQRFISPPLSVYANPSFDSIHTHLFLPCR